MSNTLIEQNAFVLHSRPFKENQQLVELLTQHHGKVSALVFVGQSKRSIKKGLVQPFLPIKVTFKDNDSSLKRITNIEASARSYDLRKLNLYSAFYINELLIRLLNDDIICETLFSHYQLALSSLSQQLPIAAQLRRFELSLLDELGLSFDFSPVFEENNSNVVGFYYIAEQGFTPAYSFSVNTITTPYFDAKHLLVIADFVQDQTVIEDIAVEHTFKLLMRDVINHLLDGKPLNSRKLFKK
jgi:DNA repair protein RecO (recombination protein O)